MRVNNSEVQTGVDSEIEPETGFDRSFLNWLKVCFPRCIFYPPETIFAENGDLKPRKDLISNSHDECGFTIETEEILKKAGSLLPAFSGKPGSGSPILRLR